jgi:hypothetical protein
LKFMYKLGWVLMQRANKKIVIILQWVRWWIVCGRVKLFFFTYYFFTSSFSQWWSKHTMLLSHTQNPSRVGAFRMNQNDLVIFHFIMSIIIITNSHRLMDMVKHRETDKYTQKLWDFEHTYLTWLDSYNLYIIKSRTSNSFCGEGDFALGNDFWKTSHCRHHCYGFQLKFSSHSLFVPFYSHEVTCLFSAVCTTNNIFRIHKGFKWNFYY